MTTPGGPPAALLSAAQAFECGGPVVSIEPLLIGHINDTYVVRTGGADGRRYLLQRLNTTVFGDLDALTENISRVTAHIWAALHARGESPARRALTTIRTRDGAALLRRRGGVWRMYPYVEGTHTPLRVRGPDDAYQAGRAFGEFQRLLADLPPPRLHETIPHFHDTPRRLAALRAAVESADARRCALARTEIESVFAHDALAGALLRLHEAGVAPERIVHNDAKISNVLLDEHSGEALCVVDLDTVMPGLSLFDFGDMIRSMSSVEPEDHAAADEIDVDAGLVAAIADGYREQAGDMLTAAERAHLLDAGQVITLEQAARFLTDYLRGDVYFKIEHPEHNLQRARAQLGLLRALRRRDAELRARI